MSGCTALPEFVPLLCLLCAFLAEWGQSGWKAGVKKHKQEVPLTKSYLQAKSYMCFIQGRQSEPWVVERSVVVRCK